MKLTKTLALFAALTVAFAATAAQAVVYVLPETNNNNGNNVSAQADISAVGDHVTIKLTNTTQGMFASNQAISDLYLNFTTNVGPVANFTQSGQLANIDGNGNVTNVAGALTRWDPYAVFGDTYIDVIGGGQPNQMIASTDLGDPNGGFTNFNPYVLGTATFTFDLVGASNLRLNDLLFSFGTNHEFVGHGVCISGCGVGIGQLAAVPEASTWALMILGFGGVGAMLRRRRAQLAYA